MTCRSSASLALALVLLTEATGVLHAAPVKQAQPMRTALPWTVAPTVGPSAHQLPPRAPRVIVHAPAHLEGGEPIGLVLFFHGWSGCVRVLALRGDVGCLPGDRTRPGWGLAAAHDEAGTNSIFIAPQLLWLQRSGRAGRFAGRGFARQWLRWMIRDHITPRLGLRELQRLDEFGPITVVAHSAGFEAALAALQNGDLGTTVDRVILFDALYAGVEELLTWTLADERRRLLSVHGGSGSPRRNTRALLRLAAERLGHEEGDHQDHRAVPDLRTGRVHAMRTDVPHGDMPSVLMAQLLRAADESRR